MIEVLLVGDAMNCFKVVLCFLCFVFLIPPLFAQPAEPDTAQADTLEYTLDAITVSAPRYQKKIIDIPFSVTRLDINEFKYDRKASVSDVLETVPGLFLQSRYGNHDVRISIRGFGSRSNSGIRGVRILLDGIPESEPDGQTRIEAIDFNSVGRIEITKGNSSSLYTNAPGGVINFINDIYFPSSFVVNFNDFGSYGLRRNGFKAGIRSPHYTFLLTYSNHDYTGYRDHSDDHWHIVNTVLEVAPTDYSSLQILGYFVDGEIKLPGSLTKEEYEEDPFQAAKREVDFDFRRYSKKGRLGLRFNSYLDQKRNNQIEVTGYATIKYFERPSGTFRIINRYGLGASFGFVNKSNLFGLENEFSTGGDLLYQTGPIEVYQNINGKKGDRLDGLTNETIANVGYYVQNMLELYRQSLYLMVSGRYDKIIFDQNDQLLAVRSDRREFSAFTPKAGLHYKITPTLALYTTFGLSFDTPAGNELDNYPLISDPTQTRKLLNPDLEPQKSRNFEVGIKGSVQRQNALFFRNVNFEATVFNLIIDDEVVPFEVYSNVFFRNSARTIRRGLELGSSFNIYGGFRSNISYTYSDFSYDKYIARTIAFDNTGQIHIEDDDFSGNTVPSIPEHNLSVSLIYEQPLIKGVVGFSKLNQRYISGLWVNDANSDKTAAYGLTNITLGLDWTINGFNLLLSGGVNNLLDEAYVGFVNINSATGRFYEAGIPRNYFATVNIGYHF